MNLGIILAMAGLDYSKIKEPDFDIGNVKQLSKISDYIKELCEKIYQLEKPGHKG